MTYERLHNTLQIDTSSTVIEDPEIPGEQTFEDIPLTPTPHYIPVEDEEEIKLEGMQL